MAVSPAEMGGKDPSPLERSVRGEPILPSSWVGETPPPPNDDPNKSRTSDEFLS